MNNAAREIGADYLCVGLNADDFAQSVLMNVMRGDMNQMRRMAPHLQRGETRRPGLVPRLAPVRMIPENENLLYCMVQGIKWHDGTCPHFGQAQRNEARRMVHEMEERHPGTRFAMIAFLDRLREAVSDVEGAGSRECARCGEPTSAMLSRRVQGSAASGGSEHPPLCKVCTMIDEVREKLTSKGEPGAA